MSAAIRCDQCGRMEATPPLTPEMSWVPPLPHGWCEVVVTVSSAAHPEERVNLGTQQFCSPVCASEWLADNMAVTA